MAIKIGINGFGRIGRCVFRVLLKNRDFEVVGINDITDTKTLAHLFKYDTTMGPYDGDVSLSGENLVVDGKQIPVTKHRDPAEIPWGDLGAEIVLESTGVFRTKEQCLNHIEGGAKKVLLSVPPKDEVDAMIVLGVNDDTLKGTEQVVSNASCTTNCLAPMAKVIHENFGIKRGWMTTIHAYTNDQNIHDAPHGDLRRARAAAQNVIPTSTGAARAVGKVLPELNGKLDGIAMRVPVITGSVTDLVAELDKTTTADDVNQAFQAASQGALKGVMQYVDEPIVSSDIIGNAHSSIIDAELTAVMEGNLLKCVSWYDNEWGYSNRCVDLFTKMAG